MCLSNLSTNYPYETHSIVSILVLMDVPLEWGAWEIEHAERSVSILVLMDVPLEFEYGLCYFM